jgi:very-short-patch-repair endonuclease
MYDASIRRLLEMYPAGASCDQLLYHLRTSGTRATAADILQSLNVLSGNGEVGIVAGGRWLLSRFLGENPRASDNGLGPRELNKPSDCDVLRAVRGHAVSQPSPADTYDATPAVDGTGVDSWPLDRYRRALLNYYAATQRADPRGKVTQFQDRHGESWQLFTVNGCWWRDVVLRFAMDDLPPGLRESLSRRKETICALGYPVSLFNSSLGSELLPALLVTATWQIDDRHLVIELGDRDPVVNPDWLKSVVSASAWNLDALLEALFPVGEEADLDSVTSRMRYALAKLAGGALAPGKLADELTLGHNGLRNCAAIFLPSDGRFTQGTAADLDAMADWTEDEYRNSALHHLFSARPSDKQPEPSQSTIPLLQLRDMTERQYRAASAALECPLTVIQGPPGTGKSDVVVTLLVSIFMAGGTVLFASKNHQALNEVERRLSKLVGSHPVLTRGRDAEGDRDTNFLAALKELSASEPRTKSLPPAVESFVAAAKAESSKRALREKRSELEIELAECIERALALEALGQPLATLPIGFWRRWYRRITGFVQPRRQPPDRPLRDGARPAEIRHRIEVLRRDIEEKLDADALAPFVQQFAEFVTRMDLPARQTLLARIKEMDFNGVTKSKKLLAEEARLLLRHRPVWAISTLSVPSRVPPIAGLFDFVIIDEASQCDVASALPLIARAKRAVIVGDPMQLSFVPQLSRQQEHALMDAAQLPKTGRSSIAQSINSLFDFAEKRPMSRRLFLADQFRSAPGIVDYINQEFYAGRLVGRRGVDDLRLPRDYKPGLAWHDVKGRPSREEGGNVNVIEANAVVDLVLDMVRQREFEGSIGVLSPFDAQVGRITRLAKEQLSLGERTKVSLKVATIDKFQGGEADVILFSPVIGEGAGFGITNFLKHERRRLNVAISRARSLCIVVGDLDHALKSDIPHIRNLARQATTPFSPPRAAFDSEWERRLDTAMRRRGLQANPQYPVGRKYLDFALFGDGVKLDVEVDGRAFHTDADGNRKISDRLRDKELIARGWKVRRFWVSELYYDMGTCLDRIQSDLRTS